MSRAFVVFLRMLAGIAIFCVLVPMVLISGAKASNFQVDLAENIAATSFLAGLVVSPLWALRK